MKLNKINSYKFEIKLLTGLHIGTGDSELMIGGTDKSVVKRASDDMPFIPGSSLKGKMRSLLELKNGLSAITDGDVFGCDDLARVSDEHQESAQVLLKLFGSSGSNEALAHELGPTRLIVRDAYLSEETKEQFNAIGKALTEAKAENSINRITAVANPRFLERVVDGVKFDVEFSLRVFNDDPKDIEQMLFEGMALLEKDAIGAHGSRGYGRVLFAGAGEREERLLTEAREQLQ